MVIGDFLSQSKVARMVNGDGINVFKGDLLGVGSLKYKVIDGGWGDSDVSIGGR